MLDSKLNIMINLVHIYFMNLNHGYNDKEILGAIFDSIQDDLNSKGKQLDTLDELILFSFFVVFEVKSAVRTCLLNPHCFV